MRFLFLICERGEIGGLSAPQCDDPFQICNEKTATSSLLRIFWNTIGPLVSRMRAELDANPAARFVRLVRIVYMACGFRNIDNMIDMIMLRYSDIDVRLPWDYEAA